jgi:hypothetical protein
MEHLFLMFLDHTQRRTTFGRSPLDECSARRRDRHLTTHDTYNRQISMPRWDSNPQSQQVSGLRPLTCWDRLWCVVVCDLETSRIGAPYIYIYDISSLRVKQNTSLSICPYFSLRLALDEEIRSNLRRLDRMLSGPQSQSGCEGERYSAGPPGFESRSFSPQPNCYTDHHYRLAGLNNDCVYWVS